MMDTDSNLSAFEEKALAHCRRLGLFAPGGRVIAACSGGADSVALLLFLLRCQKALGLAGLEAVHIHHGIRGQNADRDADFVADLCQHYGLKLRMFRAGEPGWEVPPHPGEDWARRFRYACFEKALADCPGGIIATAHTATDQAETLLLRLARGTGVHGLAGIPASRPGIVRPLLSLTRSETEGYCRALGQRFVTDESNLGDAYARNRIRHHAIPALESVNPAAVEALGRLSAQMSALDSYFTGKATELLKAAEAGENRWRLEVLSAADEPVLARACHLLIGRFRDPEEKYVRLLLSAIADGRGAVQITEKTRFLARGGVLVIPQEQKIPPKPVHQPLRTGCFTLPGGYDVSVQVQNCDKTVKSGNVHKKDLKFLADYDKIPDSAFLRGREPGDTFSPAGRGVKKTMKKWLNEWCVPVAERAQLPVLAVENRVLWVWGQGFAEGLSPDETTCRLLSINEGGKNHVDG